MPACVSKDGQEHKSSAVVVLRDVRPRWGRTPQDEGRKLAPKQDPVLELAILNVRPGQQARI